MTEQLSPAKVARITAYLDAEAPPSEPTAHIVFGTMQLIPAELIARRHHDGLVPLIILTGGVNRHTGLAESDEHHRRLLELGVPEAAIRREAESLTTRENLERALPFLREALEAGLGLTAVCKWYHRRALHLLRAFLPDVPEFHVVTWEPIYDGVAVTRSNWWHASNAATDRVLHEWRVIPERLAAGTLAEVERIDGAWR